MSISKSDIKILKYLYHKHRPISYGALAKKYNSDAVDRLMNDGLLDSPTSYAYHDGVFADALTDDTAISLTKTGECAVEDRQWFDVKYLLTQIIVPILVGIVSAVVTAILLRMI